LREKFAVFRDGFSLQQLSNQTTFIQYPGSGTVSTETGLWSLSRSGFADFKLEGVDQDFSPVWLIYSNYNSSKSYIFDCDSDDVDFTNTALLAPFAAGTIVKNLFHPFDEQLLIESARWYSKNYSTPPNGCLSSLQMRGYDFRA